MILLVLFLFFLFTCFFRFDVSKLLAVVVGTIFQRCRRGSLGTNFKKKNEVKTFVFAVVESNEYVVDLCSGIRIEIDLFVIDFVQNGYNICLLILFVIQEKECGWINKNPTLRINDSNESNLY